MAAAISKVREADRKRMKAWELHLAGVNQLVIADELGCTQARVSQLIKQACALHPVNKLSLEERIALSEGRWNLAEQELRDEIARQRQEGRLVEEVTTYPDGTTKRVVTRMQGVDPAVLRAYGMHVDRRNRQAQNQMAPDSARAQGLHEPGRNRWPAHRSAVERERRDRRLIPAPQMTYAAWDCLLAPCCGFH
jgi:hypothetical protein